MSATDLLIAGAGPFGLALARYARENGIEHTIVGRPMEFWRRHMPANMWLRSGPDWHLDSQEQLTMASFLESREVASADPTPLTIERYLEYVDWFQQQAGIEVADRRIERVVEASGGGFEVAFSDGETLAARRVVLAMGFHAFRNVPADLVLGLPEGTWSHTRDFVDMSGARGQRYLIVGGRQSAFEWAALLAEAGAAAVHVVHRHDTPRFAESHWSWVPELLRQLELDPAWFRSLELGERKRIAQRFWEEGRLKLEPWLPPRMPAGIVHIRPNAEIDDWRAQTDGALRVVLTTGDVVEVNQIVLATGYKVDTDRLAFLDAPIRAAIRTDHGFPDLDPTFQSAVPGLYFTSMPAARDFGPYMGFTVSVPYTTRIIGRALKETRAAG